MDLLSPYLDASGCCSNGLLDMMQALTVRKYSADDGRTERRQLLLKQLREVRCFLPVQHFLKKRGKEECCAEEKGIGPNEKLTLLLLASVEDPPLLSPLNEEVMLLRSQLKAVCEHEQGLSVANNYCPEAETPNDRKRKLGL
jgi:hypothetical protein